MDDAAIWVKVLVGAAGGSIVWALTYYILHRRLYAVTSYYTRSALSDTGKAVAFTVLNRGHRSEADIRLELDPSRKYSLLAQSSEAVALEGGVLQVRRLPPRDSVGAVLLIEGGDFDNDKIIKLSSAEARGKVMKSLEQVPPPPGVALLVVLILLGIAVVGGGVTFLAQQDKFFANDLAAKQNDEQTDATVKALAASGWRGVESYARSEISRAYSKGDFPIDLVPVGRVDDFVALDVHIKNRLKDWLTATVKLDSTEKESATLCQRQIVDDFKNNVMVSGDANKTLRMIVFLPRNLPPSAQLVRAEITLEAGSETIYGPRRFIDVSTVPVAADTKGQKGCPAEKG